MTMTDLNRELAAGHSQDFETTAAKDTSTTSTRNFSDAEEQAAIAAAAKACKTNRR